MKTSRLKYSFNAQAKLLKIHNVDITIFVEGISDRFFYDQLATSVLTPLGVKFQIRSADNLDSMGGGKNVLLSFYNHLESIKALKGKMGERSSVIFYVDKDLDDIRKKLIISPYLVYTSPYHMENYLFMWGNLHVATAASANIDLRSIQDSIGDADSWRANSANLWKEWVYLCVHATIDSIQCSSNYHICSPIHKKGTNKLDRRLYNMKLSELQKACKLTKKAFSTRHQEIKELVDSLYLQSEYDKIFKGVWYINLLADSIRKSCKSIHHHANKIPNAIIPLLQQTLDFRKEWAVHLCEPLENIARCHIAA